MDKAKLEEEVKALRIVAQRKLVSFLLHPVTRNVTEFCAVATEVIGDIRDLKGPLGWVLGGGAMLEQWATRISPGGNGPAMSYLEDVLDLVEVSELPVNRFLMPSQIRHLPGLQYLVSDKEYTAYFWPGQAVDLWFVLPTVKKDSKKQDVSLVDDGQGADINVYVRPNTPHAAILTVCQNLIRNMIAGKRGQQSRLLEITESGGRRLQALPVSEDLSHHSHDAWERSIGAPCSLIDLANDISGKRRRKRSPAYVLFGDGGCGKTSLAKAVGELMGGLTVVMGPSSLANNTIGVIVGSLAPDIVIIDDFDKTERHVRNQFYTTLLSLRATYPKTAWFITTNDTKDLGAPMLRPGRGGRLLRFLPPTPEEVQRILVSVNIPAGDAVWIADRLPAGMTQDWIAILGHEITQAWEAILVKSEEERAAMRDAVRYALTEDWFVNWFVVTAPDKTPPLFGETIVDAEVDDDDDDDDEECETCGRFPGDEDMPMCQDCSDFDDSPPGD